MASGSAAHAAQNGTESVQVLVGGDGLEPPTLSV